MPQCPTCGSTAVREIRYGTYECQAQALIGVQRDAVQPAGIPVYRTCGTVFEDWQTEEALGAALTCYLCGYNSIARCVCHKRPVCRRHHTFTGDKVYCPDGVADRQEEWAANRKRLEEERTAEEAARKALELQPDIDRLLNYADELRAAVAEDDPHTLILRLLRKAHPKPWHSEAS